MNRDKFYVVLGSILVLMHGFSTGAWSADPVSHGTDSPSSSDSSSAVGRDTVRGSLPTVYKDLEKLIVPEGFQANWLPIDKTTVEHTSVSSVDSGKLLKWVKKFENY